LRGAALFGVVGNPRADRIVLSGRPEQRLFRDFTRETDMIEWISALWPVLAAGLIGGAAGWIIGIVCGLLVAVGFERAVRREMP
jgi:hypothetical protein